VPVDARYGDLNDDKIPEVSVGRIAVNTLDEARTVVDKILAYDENGRDAAWQRLAVFVSDNADSSGDFPAVSDEIIGGYLPPDLSTARIYLQGSAMDQVTATRAALSSAWQSGALMVQFTGHGAPARWTHEQILMASDIPTLTNGGKLPVVMTFNCLDGYFAHAEPGLTSIAELMQRHAGGGSIAAISPAGLGITSDQQAFRKILMNVMFDENVRELGRALTVAKQRFAQVYGPHYLTQTMTFFGDPAMQLPGNGGPKRMYLPRLSR
jgi:hypothetical protein